MALNEPIPCTHQSLMGCTARSPPQRLLHELLYSILQCSGESTSLPVPSRFGESCLGWASQTVSNPPKKRKENKTWGDSQWQVFRNLADWVGEANLCSQWGFGHLTKQEVKGICAVALQSFIQASKFEVACIQISSFHCNAVLVSTVCSHCPIPVGDKVRDF